jgi:hypothetical protein
VLLLVYSLLLHLAPHLSATQDQWQLNVTLAETYLYDEKTVRNAIVGSSISERLVMDGLPDFANLSFSGLSAFDGLNLLKHKHAMPATVFIETNVLLRKRDDNFGTTVLSPIPFWLRKHMSALRSDKQPLALVGQSLGEIIGETGQAIKHNISGMGGGQASDSAGSTAAPASDSEILKLQIRDYSETPNEQVLQAQLQLLSDDVAYLKRHGVRVVFFEMPVDSRLAELPKARLVRESVQAVFPKEQYDYIAMPDPKGYVTSDGIHLNRQESRRYTQYFVEQATRLDSAEAH